MATLALFGGAGMAASLVGGQHLPAPAQAAPAAEAVTDVDLWGHVYVHPAAVVVVPRAADLACEYMGTRLTVAHGGPDRQPCPGSAPAADIAWPAAGVPSPAVDPSDPDIPACRAAGGRPVPPQLGGGGGAGAPVDFCLVGGHMWGPGGPLGPPWGTTVDSAVECRLLGGVDRDPAQGYGCILR